MSARGIPIGALVVLLLAVATVGNIAAPVRPIPDIAPQTSSNLAIKPLPEQETSGIPTMARFRAARDRPPFLRGRRPIVLSVGAEASESDDELGRLLAIGLTSQEEIALLNPVNSDQTIMLRLGDEIKGWSVSAIERNFVRFIRAQEVVVLHLKESSLADGSPEPLALGEVE